jgi:hypothetical protein
MAITYVLRVTRCCKIAQSLQVFIHIDCLHEEDTDKLLEEEKPLMPLRVLSKIFSELLDRTRLHIFVKLPPVSSPIAPSLSLF